MSSEDALHPLITEDGLEAEGYVPADHLEQKASVLPNALEGKSVLDIGTFDGYFAFEAARRGATEVVAIDKMGKTNRFEETQEQSKTDAVVHRTGNFFDLTFDQEFDVVICFGVFYHTRHPHRLLNRLSELAAESVCIETGIIPSPRQQPRLFHTDNVGLSWPKVLQLVRDFDEWFPTAEWVRRELGRRALELEREASFVGAQQKKLLPFLAALPSTERFWPMTSRYAVRASLPESREHVTCHGCGGLIAYSDEPILGPNRFIENGECPNCGYRMS